MQTIMRIRGTNIKFTGEYNFSSSGGERFGDQRGKGDKSGGSSSRSYDGGGVELEIIGFDTRGGLSARIVLKDEKFHRPAVKLLADNPAWIVADNSSFDDDTYNNSDANARELSERQVAVSLQRSTDFQIALFCAVCMDLDLFLSRQNNVMMLKYAPEEPL
jgi:hypothetical protein